MPLGAPPRSARDPGTGGGVAGHQCRGLPIEPFEIRVGKGAARQARVQTGQEQDFVLVDIADATGDLLIEQQLGQRAVGTAAGALQNSVHGERVGQEVGPEPGEHRMIAQRPPRQQLDLGGPGTTPCRKFGRDAPLEAKFEVAAGQGRFGAGTEASVHPEMNMDHPFPQSLAAIDGSSRRAVQRDQEMFAERSDLADAAASKAGQHAAGAKPKRLDPAMETGASERARHLVEGVAFGHGSMRRGGFGRGRSVAVKDETSVLDAKTRGQQYIAQG